MATQVNNGQNLTGPTHAEAPASATLKVVSPRGFEWLLTQRADTTQELMTRAEGLEAWLIKHDWKPAGQRALPMGNSAPAEDAPTCAIHKKPMTRRSKDGRSWWSCAERLENGDWCPYRPKGGA